MKNLSKSYQHNLDLQSSLSSLQFLLHSRSASLKSRSQGKEMKGESDGPCRRREGTWTGTRRCLLREKQRKPHHRKVEEAEVSSRKPDVGFLLIALREAICRKGSISPKPLEAVSVLCKSMSSSNGGLSSFKGAGMLPLGKLIQRKLASGWYS